MTTAIYSQGTHIQFETTPGSGVYTSVAHVKGDCTSPMLKNNVKEVTDHDSPGAVIERIATTTDPGTVKFTLNYQPTATTHIHVQSLAASKAIINWRYLMVDEAASHIDFAGFVLSFGPVKGPVDGPYEADAEIQVSGLPTFPS